MLSIKRFVLIIGYLCILNKHILYGNYQGINKYQLSFLTTSLSPIIIPSKAYLATAIHPLVSQVVS
jgi:hypothetical protein